MLFGPDEIADNGPETWKVEKRAEHLWSLLTKGNVGLDTFPTRKAALAAKGSGFLVELYNKEHRWYAGEQIPSWRPWSECEPEYRRHQQRQAIA